MLLFLKFGASFPMASSTVKGRWIASDSAAAACQGAITAAAALRLTKDFIRHLTLEFGLTVSTVSQINLVSLGVHTPQSGTVLLVSAAEAARASSSLQIFTGRRPVRTFSPTILLASGRSNTGQTDLLPLQGRGIRLADSPRVTSATSRWLKSCMMDSVCVKGYDAVSIAIMCASKSVCI